MDDATYRLDTSGLLCPLPVRLAARRAADLPVGSRLEVTGDDPAMALDFRVWCERAGHRLLELEERAGRVRCLLELGTAGP
ncbi:MAG TPA: sulfurtransferase TusA family protein [Thermoanaerobaculia bacterium]|nr:sulfurtransferase TusA family protein [Thermoanaerobaculia bacterium]